MPRLNDGPNINLVELYWLVGAGIILLCCLVIRGSVGGFLLLRYFSGVISHPRGLRVTQNFISTGAWSFVSKPLLVSDPVSQYAIRKKLPGGKGSFDAPSIRLSKAALAKSDMSG